MMRLALIYSLMNRLLVTAPYVCSELVEGRIVGWDMRSANKEGGRGEYHIRYNLSDHTLQEKCRIQL